MMESNLSVKNCGVQLRIGNVDTVKPRVYLQQPVLGWTTQVRYAVADMQNVKSSEFTDLSYRKVCFSSTNRIAVFFITGLNIMNTSNPRIIDKGF
jgi:hypothetical protein